MRSSYSIKLSGPVTVTSDWTELKAEKPLKADKDIQWVLLELEAPFQENSRLGPDSKGGILTPDGKVVNPEIEVVDQYGNTFSLIWSGTRGGGSGYHLAYPKEFPRDREYKMVRIRSSRPIKCKAIYWFCDSSKDWK